MSEQTRSTKLRGYRKVQAGRRRAPHPRPHRRRRRGAARDDRPGEASISAIAETGRGDARDGLPPLPGRRGAVPGLLGAVAGAAATARPRDLGDVRRPLGASSRRTLDIYRYYRAGEQMLTMIHRDFEVVPDRVRDARLGREGAVAVRRCCEVFPAHDARPVGLRSRTRRRSAPGAPCARPGAPRRCRRRPDGRDDEGGRSGLGGIAGLHSNIYSNSMSVIMDLEASALPPN